MAKFTFQLDPLLRARLLAERQSQRAVAAVNRERMVLEDSLRTQQTNVLQGKHSHRSGLIGMIDLSSLRMQAATSIAAMRKAQRIVLELAGVHKRLEAARSELTQAMKARRVIEILRERRLQEWTTAQDKAEVNELDELAVIAAARKRTANSSSNAISHQPEATS